MDSTAGRAWEELDADPGFRRTRGRRLNGGATVQVRSRKPVFAARSPKTRLQNHGLNGYKAVVLLAFGEGNLPQLHWPGAIERAVQRGVAVVIEAAHQCMTTRGIHKPGVTMVTSRMLGAFRDDATTRREFLAMIGNPRGQTEG